MTDDIAQQQHEKFESKDTEPTAPSTEDDDPTLELEEESLDVPSHPSEHEAEKVPAVSEVVVSFVPLHPIGIGRSAATFLLMVVAIMLYRLNLITSISSHVYGGSSRDAGFYLWLFEQARELFSLPWFATQAFYPYGMTLAWSDNFILPSLAGSLLTLFGISDIAAYNIALLTALILNGFFTYLLAHRITGAFFASLITGLGFSFYSFFTHNAGHPQLLFFFWIPLSILCLIHYIASIRRRWLLASILCVVGSFLCSVYYALFLSLLIPTFGLGLYLVRPYYFGRRQLFDFALSCCLGLALLSPFIFPYLETKALFGGRYLYEPFFFSATGLSYFAVTTHHMAYSSVFSGLSNIEATLFPGFTLTVFLIAAVKRLGVVKSIKQLGQVTVLSVVLAFVFSDLGSTYEAFYYSSSFFTWLSIILAALFLRLLGNLERSREYYVISNRNFIGIFLFSGLLFALLSLGPIGNVAEGQYVFSPFAALFTFIPGFNAIRAAGRMGVVAVWCAFMTLPFLLPLIRGKKRWGIGFYTLTAFLLIAENLCSTYPLEEAPKTPTAYHLAQKSLEATDSLIALPVSPVSAPEQPGFDIDTYARHSVNTMLWSKSGRFKLVNGYSGQISAMHKNLSQKTKSFPDPRSFAALGSISNLSHIIYHGNEVPGFNVEEFEQAVENDSQISIVAGSKTPLYLLEFNPETRLSERFRLLLPSNQSGSLTLELKALYQENSPDVTVDIFIEDFYEESPFATLPVAASDAFEPYSIHLPETSQRMKPLKVFFKSSAPGQVYLKKRIFTPERH